MIRLSVIVPFYGVEQYIEQCIRSLYDQDIPQEEYEVICVDDCSPDGSRAIVECLQREYPNLQLICHTENKRQGGARNTGLRAAKGEYIWFVDSDDYVMSHVMGTLLKEAEQNKLDILQFKFKCYLDEYKYPENIQDTWGPTTGADYVLNAPYQWDRFVPLVWRTFYKRSYIDKCNLCFVEGLQYEDTDFALKAFYFASRVQMISTIGYMYRVNPSSTVHSVISPTKVRDQVMLLYRTYSFMTEVRSDDYGRLLWNYVMRDLGRLGKDIEKMNNHDRLRYAVLMSHQRCGNLKRATSFRNWLRVKYGICI